jgi:Domain of unknown function (DUF4157)
VKGVATAEHGRDRTAHNLEAARSVLALPGVALEWETRASLETAFATDLSTVRIHTDRQAALSARSLGAAAYTFGHHIVFGAGRYRPETSRGQRLLAHELTHVLQQRRAPADPSLGAIDVDNEHSSLELQARSAPRAPGIRGAITPRIQRAKDGEEPSEAAAPQFSASTVLAWPAKLELAQRGEGTHIETELQKTPTDPILKNVTAVSAKTLTPEQKYIVSAIGENRKKVAIPNFSFGSYKFTEGGQDVRRFGYMYMGKGQTPTALATHPKPDDRDAQIAQQIWEELIKTEGAPSAINAYDPQVVTYGPGLGALGKLPPVLDEIFKVQAVQDFFLPLGISWQNRQFLVVNTQTGLKETGRDALNLIQGRKDLLAALSAAAESADVGQTIADAQFNEVKKTISEIPEKARTTWSLDAIMLAFHLDHWGPKYGWSNHKKEYVDDTGGDVLKIVTTWGRLASGGAEASGAFLISSPSFAGAIPQFKIWGHGKGWEAIRAVCPIPVPLTKAEAGDAKRTELKDKVLIRTPSDRGKEPAGYYIVPSMPVPLVGNPPAASPSSDKPNYFTIYELNGLEIHDLLDRLASYDVGQLKTLAENSEALKSDFGARPTLAIKAVRLKKERASAAKLSGKAKEKALADVDSEADALLLGPDLAALASQSKTDGEVLTGVLSAGRPKKSSLPGRQHTNHRVDVSYESEADRVADRVAGSASLSRPKDSQPRPMNGQPLPADLRQDMQAIFSCDFSNVRVYSDDDASRWAATRGARAYTRGSHIVFAKGAFAPDSVPGRWLLGHELAHVTQQRSAAPELQLQPAAAPPPTGIETETPQARLTRQAAEAVAALSQTVSDADARGYGSLVLTVQNTGSELVIGFTKEGEPSQRPSGTIPRELSSVSRELKPLIDMMVMSGAGKWAVRYARDKRGYFSFSRVDPTPAPCANPSAQPAPPPSAPATPAPAPGSDRACFDGKKLTVTKNGKSASTVAFTDTGSPTPPGRFCIRRRGEAQTRGGAKGVIGKALGGYWQNREHFYLLEPQFPTTRSKLDLHYGHFSKGCITVSDLEGFRRIEAILDQAGTTTARGYDGFPPGNEEKVDNPPRDIDCVADLEVTSSGGCDTP